MAQITYGSITVSDLTDGKNANIWTTTVAPVTPNYTFTISNLTGSSDDPREGDIILYDVYRYTISSVGTTTVLAGNRQSLQGEPGTPGAPGSPGSPGTPGASVTRIETEYYKKLAGGQAPQPETTGSTTIPEYDDGCTYYTRTVTYLSVGDPVKGDWSEAITLTTQIKNAYDAWIAAGAAEIKLKQFFPDTYGLIVTGEADAEVDQLSTYGYNTIMAPNYLGLRYNAINLAKLTTTESTPELQFYFPSFSGSSNTPVQGDKGLTLGASGMGFYHPGSSTADVTLNSSGLTITNGAIQFGTGGASGTSSGNVRLANVDFNRSINNTNRTNLRLAIGDKFGVKNDGTLYANNAVISGQITVGQGSNVYTTDNVNPLQIGGRNLLLATPKDYNATAYRIYQLPLSENLVVGETYTLQFWGVSLDSNSTGLRPFWGGANNVLTPLTKPDSSGYWAQTFTVGTPSSSTEAANKWLAIYNAPSGHTGANGSISKWKLEKGNKATDWTPAPEDTINDNLVNGSQKMDGWKRNSNASLDTSSEFGDVTLTGSSSNWHGGILTAPTMRTSILDGSALWLSLEYKASSASTLHIEFSGTSANPDTSSPGSQTKYRTWNYSVASTSSWTKLAYPMLTLLSELTGGSGDVNSLYIAFYNRTDNSTMHIRKVKLEHGLAPTEWTPSPEDFKTYITRIDDGGIFISPSNQSPTSSAAGNSVRIDGSGMNVYKDNNLLASYGTSIVLYNPTTTTKAVEITSTSASFTGNVKATSFSTGTKTASTTGKGFYVDSSGNIYVGDGSNNYFSVSNTGVLTARSGTIGGWGITSNMLYHYADSSGNTATATAAKYYLYIQSAAGSNGGNYAFAIRTRTDDEVTANSPTISSATVQFGVSWTGYMVARNATVSGTITATAGTIGGCSISNGVLQVAAANITSGTIAAARIPNLAISKITDLSTSLTSAGNTADSFIYYTSSTGLKLAQSNPSSATSNYVNITSTAISIIKDSTHKSVLNSSGMQVYSGDATNAIAQFGSIITLGKTTQSYLNIYTKGTDGIEGVIDFYKGSTLIGTIESTYTSSTSNISLNAHHGGNIGTFSVGPTGANLWFGVPGNPPIDFGSTGTISANSYIESSNSNGSVRLVVDSGHRGIYDSGNSQWVIYSGTSKYIYVNNTFGPGTNSTSTSTGYYLGWSDHRWRGVYSYSAPNSVSDKKDKDIIGSIDYAKELIMKLKPIEYQWKNSDHNRIHLGLIAQDVAKIGKELNKNLSIYEANYKNSEQKYHGEEVDDNELSWGMTYTELIAPMIKVIQEQEQRIQKLESIIKGGNVNVSD